MQKYERIIGLKTIYMTLLRRTEAILVIFFSLSLVAFVVTNFFIPKEYTSHAVFTNTAAINDTTYSLIKNKIKDDSTIENIAKNLKSNKVFHANGKEIAKTEILSGLSFSGVTSGMVNFTVSFKCSEQTLAQYVLTEVTGVSLDVLKPTYPNINISTPATTATKTSKESTYLLIGVAASLVLALIVPFVYEIANDTVYQTSDLSELGIDGYELRASGKSQKEGKLQ